MREIPDASVDAIITDPPYPEISRPYGRMTEADWHTMMRGVVAESRRVLKPRGSAVFILQANSERVGRMRPWLWEFMAWTAREWNQVQDAYWWNISAPPTVHCQRKRGLMKPSLKHAVWLGDPNCFRNQDAVLLPVAESTLKDTRREQTRLQYTPQGGSYRKGRALKTCIDRGGSTPFNLNPLANSNAHTSGAAYGHGAATPEPLADWWMRYISPPGGIVLDPFAGSGTIPLAAMKRGRKAIGIERDPAYYETARRRIHEAARPEAIAV